ncbi:hypothetical protein VUR80DRAFT_9082 [Thermomyces stellatus]
MCLFFRRHVMLRDDSSLEAGPRPSSRQSFNSAKLASTVSTTPASSRRSSTANPPMRQVQGAVCHLDMTRRDMYEALDAIAEALPDTPYAIVGGLALMLLGSTRPTKDIDIVVPDGKGAEVATLLAAEGMFGTATTVNGKRRVWFDASSNRRYNVDVLEPHDIGQVFPQGVPETRNIQGYPVLDPKQLLNFKIASWTDRMGTQSVKKENHARDVLFLVDYLAKKKVVVDQGEVYHATDQFLMLFNATYVGSAKALEKVGLTRTGASRKNSADARAHKMEEWWQHGTLSQPS